ncbi:MAG: ABC transporter ATP-binding protein [Bdellovibrionales bacterium]|jgi:lipooligosaccharide transport system ATP-binding protein|nr:ABC transporter ATP-binding protein [Bdellovibrionales bacterium]MBL7669149.1 ABC transporter ATP-binding protein [Pseudobdellovibrionaceae bacterium]
MSELSAVVQIKNVVKKYDDRTALNGISFEIRKGECFGLLGPNGAGKSTTMKLMYGSARLTSGEMYILGLNVKKNEREIKSRIGVVPQDDGLDVDLTVQENLLIFANYHRIDRKVAYDRTLTLIRMMKLEDYQDRPVEVLSGGLRRRLAIARGLINNPEILFLDEPTAGLDPQSRLFVWDFFQRLKEEKSTIVMTTHYMEEAERICDRIAIIDQGRILDLDSPDALIRKHVGKEVVEFECSPQDSSYYTGRLTAAGFAFQVMHRSVSVLIGHNQESRQVMGLVASDRIVIRKATLNDVFLKLAGHHLRDQS